MEKEYDRHFQWWLDYALDQTSLKHTNDYCFSIVHFAFCMLFVSLFLVSFVALSCTYFYPLCTW